MLGLLFVALAKHDIGYIGMFVISAIFSSTAALMTYILDERKQFDYL